jgi:hypothetical protein
LMVEARWGSRYGERKGQGRLPSKCGALTHGYWDAEAARGKGEGAGRAAAGAAKVGRAAAGGRRWP